MARVRDKLAQYRHVFPTPEAAEHATFADLAALQAQGHPVRTLSLMGTCRVGVEQPVPKEFSAESTPDAILADAVRISLSIPWLFYPHPEYVRRNNQRVAPRPHLQYVDGGVLCNFPQHIFDKERYREGFAGADDAASLPRYNPHSLGLALEANPVLMEAWLQSPDVPESMPNEGPRAPPSLFGIPVIAFAQLLTRAIPDAYQLLQDIDSCWQNVVAHNSEGNDWQRTVFITPGEVRGMQQRARVQAFG